MATPEQSVLPSATPPEMPPEMPESNDVPDTPGGPDPQGAPRRDIQIYARLLAYVVPYWAAFLISIGGYLLYSVSNVAFLQLVSYIVDSLQGSDPLMKSEYGNVLSSVFGDGESLNRTIIPIAIVVIVMSRGLGTFIGNYFTSYVANNLIHNLRCELFDQLMRLPSRFFDRSRAGHLVAKPTYHVNQVTGAATDAVRVIIREGFTVIGYLAFLLYLNWKLTLLFIAVAPIIALLVTYAGKRFRRISERIQGSMGDVTHAASEAISGYREVRTFGGQQYERQRFQRVSQDNRRQSMKMVVTASIATPVVQLLVATALAALVWLVLDPMLLSDMTPGNVVAFITTGGLLAKPIRQLSEVNATVQKGLAAAQDIFELFDEEVEQDEGTVVLDRIEGKVTFSNVSFGYGQGQPAVLKELDFEVLPGETIALVGRSGGGKSTLVSLIPRFYSPTHGTICIDNIPIEDLTLTSLRSHMAIVSQQVTLFNDTVMNNIAYGALQGASRESIEIAARKAHAWEFISRLPDGLDTIVGDDGVLLSGGQRQRIAIARAFLKDSPILILDEATSSLDQESERYIQAALEEVVKGRTTFIIAHRLSTIEKADRILVLDEGRIVEQGTHGDLLSGGGAYARQHSGGERPATSPASGGQLPARTDERGEGKGRVFHPLVQAWNQDAAWLNLLRPFGVVFHQLARFRRWRLESGEKQWRPPVPVIVVGNINIGGTGKSPLVLWLVERLRERGYLPGVVSRGYGGRASRYPLRILGSTSPRESGDEALMIARRSGCPVVVDPDRVAAAKHLLAETECNLIISDDGLQHYRLQRDVEIAVVDGTRGLGNGRCLPAGPLREPPQRLTEVDFVVVNGMPLRSLPCQSHAMTLSPSAYRNLATGEVLQPEAFTASIVHGVAGISHPIRFFDTLRGLGHEVIEHPFADHYEFRPHDLVFEDDHAVIMTEKDAVKCREIASGQTNLWYLEVTAELADDFMAAIVDKIEREVHHREMITDSGDRQETA